jgi:glycosyltransferase involved in cell wall biosynthesis
MYFSNTVVCLLKPLIGYRVITAEHNTNDGKNSLQRKINRFLNRLSYTTVVDSNMVADYLSETEKLPRDRFTVIHNGVDITAIEESRRLYCPKRDVLRAEFSVASDEKLFLTIGRMVRQKNHLRMVDAFALLVKSRPNCKLMIIGDGGFKDEIELRVKQLGVSDKVILLGSRKDIHQFYVMSDITLLSSDHEGFCIAAMEGLAFGAPLVSTRVAGVVEYLEDGKNGFFAEKTPEDLAEKMEKIVDLSESNFIDFQENSRRTALNYSLESYGKRLTKLFIDCYNS